MNRLLRTAAVLGLLATASAALGAPAPMAILTRAMSLHKGVRDYTATVTVSTDIPDVEIPTRTAKVYVKPPDKTYVESRGLVFIPKRALLFGDIARDIEKEASVSLVSAKTSGGATTYCLKIAPRAQPAPGRPAPAKPGAARPGAAKPRPAPARSAPQARILVWVNGARWTLDRLEVSESGRTVTTVQFTYVQAQGFWMPAKVTATIPASLMGGAKPGHASIAFSDYRVNVGLTDEFFQKMEAKSRRGHARSTPPQHPGPGAHRARPQH
jgi:outer membrane lipoprotein-sorting protein